MTARRALLSLAAVLVGAAALAVGLSGQRGDAALAVVWVAVGVLCLPCMIVWLVRGGRRR